MISFQTDPTQYRHWRLSIDGNVATLAMDVAEDGGLSADYELKLNSYDLAVDIELHDAVQRLRFEHPGVGAVVITSAKERVFCAGANIRMLAGASHPHKVNFCKFTNETRLTIEDATANSGQTYICAINGPAAGGGYELALACDYIVMADDGSTSVALPELPMLAVLPGTGGLTRLGDKRKVRRDRADVFCTLEEGMRGQRALDWRLIDELAPRSTFDAAVGACAKALAGPARGDTGITLTPLNRTQREDGLDYDYLAVGYDRASRCANITIRGPDQPAPRDVAEIHQRGAAFWPLKLARELDDAILHLRLNEPELGTWLVRSDGDGAGVAAYDALLASAADEDWLARETVLLWKRVLKRFELSARSIFALIEPGSCFTGTLLELALAADRGYMLEGQFDGDNRPPASVAITAMNFAPYPMGNGLTRLAARCAEDADSLREAAAAQGEMLSAAQAEALGLVTFAPDDIDWADEVRLAIEERAAFSADALTGMEANLRFAGPETMETKIFGRLSAWQNWIFQRPNAAGADGALAVYGTGRRGEFDHRRT